MGGLHGVVANIVDSDVVLSELELQSLSFIDFQTNTQRVRYKYLILYRYELKNNMAQPAEAVEYTDCISAEG